MRSVASILSDPSYLQLKVYVLDHTGLHYYGDKDADFAARVLRRMTARGAAGCASYLAMLVEGAGAQAEIEALIGELTIGETYFFRQREHFELLRQRIIPEIFTRNTFSRRIRIWSAGCATGAEPYSLALLLQLDFGAQAAGWDVSILGTDINVDFLQQARDGVFGAWALRSVPENIKDACFEAEGARLRLRPRYRQNVSFAYNNLVSPLPFPGSAGDPFDLILCRNVMIYFSRDIMKGVAERLQGSLAQGGWLLVGHAEAAADIFGEFTVGDYAAGGAYRRTDPKIPKFSAPPSPRIELAIPDPLDEYAITSPAIVDRETPEPAPSMVSSVEGARTLADCGEFERAAEICRAVLKADPLCAPAYFTMGLVFEHTRSVGESEGAFRRAIYLDRRFAMAHYHLGTTLLAAGDGDAARKSFENVIDLLRGRPLDEPVPLGDGMTAGELGDLSRMHLDVAGRRKGG
jgi:chemotaxis protein methyltransferase CheR